MIKKVCISLFLLLFVSFPCFAEDKTVEEQFSENTGQYLDDAITDEAKDFFDENGISATDPEGISKLSVKEVFKYLLGQIKAVLSAPIKLLALIIGISLLIGLVTNLGFEETNSSLAKVLDIAGVLICLVVMFPYIEKCISITSKTLVDGGNFMMCYVPVFAGIVGASGSLTSASIYNVGVLAVSEIAVQIAVRFLLPMMGIFFAMSIIEAINPALSLSGITNGIKKGVQWTLGLIMTIFVGLITIQSIVGVSADSVGIRTAKFMVSSFIPVIGGAMSDAYTTVRGSIGLLRSGVGSFGIIVLILTILPSLLTVTAYKVSVAVGSCVADIIGAKKVCTLLKNVSSVLSIALSLIFSFAMMLIIATTVMMLVGLNIG